MFIRAGIHRQARIQRELGAVRQLHLAGHEAIDANLRTLQVAEHAHIAAGLRGRLRAPASRRRA
jgi:hypothetical protein